jgi:L-ribulose-5-phosphate 3-epimerase
MNRRDLLKSGALLAAPQAARTAPERKFRISLAEWSVHRAIRSRFITNLDFPRIAREQFGIEGLEFVNQLWEAPTQDYVRKLKSNARSTGTQPVLIMCDAEGAMGAAVREERMKAAANHYKWVDIAAELGCHSIRANMYPDPEPKTPAEIDAFIGYCSESFNQLCEYAKARGLNVIIENHGGLSSDPDIVIRLMKMVNLPNFGTLPDFGNFPKTADRYAAIAKLLTYAKGVSFKCFDFDASGRETTMDMDRIMRSVLDSGYHNWVGIEYEGDRQTEFEGAQAGKRYLDRLLAQA